MLDMKRNDVISIIITAVVGFAGGAFLYVTHFSKLVGGIGGPEEQSAIQLQITSEAYGGCRDVCPSFRVERDGSYRYQFTPAIGAAKEFREGTIPRNIMRDVVGSLGTRSLVQQSQPIEPTNCNSYTDGIDIRYTIEFEGAQYMLDSCGTSIDDEGEVWNELAKLWNYFQTLQ